nr:zinc finger protein 761-like isoform X2 [Dermacentor andersoni]
MTEQRKGGHTPPVFAFIEEATPGTSREGGEGASGTCNDYPAYIDEYINDALKALNRQTDATDVNDATDSGSTNYAPVVSTASTDHAWPRTSHDGIEKLSSTTKDTASNSDDAWRYQWNTQPRRITGGTYNVDKFLRQPVFTNGTRSTTRLMADLPTVVGHIRNTATGSTGFTLPVYSSSGDVDAVASTSYAPMGEPSDIFGNDACNSDDTWRCQWSTQHRPITDGTYYVDGVTDNGSTSYLHLGSSNSFDHAWPSTSRTGMEEASAIIEGGARIPETTRVDQWNTHYHLADSTSTDCGHTGHTETRSTGFTLPVYSSSSPVASTSYARMQEPSGIFGNDAWNATGTGGREQQELSGACSNVASRQNALHGHTKEHTGDRAHTYKGGDSVKHCRNTPGKNHKCAACGKMFHRASLLASHYRTHTNEKPYKCEICEKSFRQSHHRDIHKRIHTGERPYTCKTCGKSFADSSHHRTHSYTHTEEKCHVCQKCTKPFKTKDSLKHHHKWCYGDRAFVCEICNASFKNNAGLGRHRLSHMDETPY